ncbi:tumor protein p63-regulated gene 1-like protein isoform X1 [Zootermopsis nevadensis]|uniref:Tumor protein p63-regulated gene 1-like protein n=1 Tax=Zootermopsis nevadensis TaxID=136037 RepID=A0A067QS48_ZOONE|nr:tumor protein p63-regulated gene 1-like protein isoform X1 [Zootermopsis nevadensis]KDR12422.1 Tumor protein p63-regulated gene 1-like protein [Zootermopsis nevadensis]
MDLSNENLLEEGPGADFQGATLQIHQDSYLCSRSPSSLENEVSVAKLSVSPDASRLLLVEREAGKRGGSIDENGLKPGVSSGVGVVAPIISIPKRISEKFKRTRSKSDTPLQSNAICQKPILEEDEAKYFFAYRDSLVQNAIKECISGLVTPDEDGEILGSWLLTEISFWDHEKERLILLTTKVLITVKYDFIALKQLEFRKVSLDLVDTLIIGDLIYPSGSIVPRLNGLTSGVMTVVKGCLLRPLQERWTQSNTEKDFCSSAFDYISFEPRSRNIRGLRAMWNNGEPLTFIKKWNPFNNDIPWTTYTSHPLLWRKDSTNSASEIYDIDDFAQNIVSAVEKAQTINIRSSHCNIEHKPIVLENYVGIGSLIHNRNSLGFFKVRGKFSF